MHPNPTALFLQIKPESFFVTFGIWDVEIIGLCADWTRN